jgi:predicted small integral membrane protein
MCRGSFPGAIKGKSRMLATRYTKAVMVLGLAVFSLLVGVDNIVDYGSNHEFVRHVLSMDTVFPDNALKWRAITNPALHTAAYVAIIAAEILVGLCFLVCAVRLFRNVRAPQASFQRAKAFGVLGSGLAFALWFIGFMVVGGEWFSMWQSTQWNGQESAFHFYMTVLAVLIFLMQPDGDPA